MKYYKGSSIKSGRRAIFKIYDEPQEELFSILRGNENDKAETYIIEASFIDQTGIKTFESVLKCGEEFCLSREIGEAEYEFYVDMRDMTEEIFNHGLTGGFPRRENVMIIAQDFRRTAERALKEMNY